MANRAGSPESEDQGSPELFLRKHDYGSLKAWIKKMEDEMDGIKEVPPLEIIEFEDLIEKAWSPARLVPWSCGKVRFRDYMDYLKKFFNNNLALRYDLHAAAKQCLKMENKYIKSDNFHGEKLSLEIMDEAKKIKNEGKAEGESAVAAAGLVCIAAEAKLMSKLPRTYTTMFNLSNDIRLYALHMMTYNGPESDAIAGAMLGISQEAKKLCRYLYPKDDRNCAKLQICFSVRKTTLRFLGHLEHRFVSGNTVNSDVNALDKPTRYDLTYALDKSARELNSDEAVVENEKNKKRKEMGVTMELEKKKRRLSSSCTYWADEKVSLRF